MLMPECLTFALDYDDTFTADPALWRAWILLAKSRGHRIVCITGRSETESQRYELETAFGPDVEVYFSDLRPKMECAVANGLHIDVWLDDWPGMIDTAIYWIDQTDADAEPREMLGMPCAPISRAPAKLPQAKGWYLWFEVDNPHSSVCDVVHIASVSDYKADHLEYIRSKPDGPFFYFNEAGEELVICWGHANGEVLKPCSWYAGFPDVDWAPFNFPDVKRVRPIIPRAAGQATL